MNRPGKALPLDLIFTHTYASDNRFLRDVGLSGWLGWQGLRHIIRRLRAITPAVMEPATRYRNPHSASCSCPACAWRPVRQADPGESGYLMAKAHAPAGSTLSALVQGLMR
jgi:hypothetical protein